MQISWKPILLPRIRGEVCRRRTSLIAEEILIEITATIWAFREQIREQTGGFGKTTIQTH